MRCIQCIYDIVGAIIQRLGCFHLISNFLCLPRLKRTFLQIMDAAKYLFLFVTKWCFFLRNVWPDFLNVRWLRLNLKWLYERATARAFVVILQVAPWVTSTSPAVIFFLMIIKHINDMTSKSYEIVKTAHNVPFSCMIINNFLVLDGILEI